MCNLQADALAFIPSKKHGDALAVMARAAACLADPSLCPWCGSRRAAHFGVDPTVTCATLARDSRPIDPLNVQASILRLAYKTKRRQAEEAIRAWVLRSLPWPEGEPIKWAHEIR